MKDNKSILFIIWALGNGGSEKMLLNIMNGAEIPGYSKVIYLYNNIPHNSYENLIRVPHKKYSRYHTKQAVFMTQLKRLLTLIRIVKKENVHLIFSFASQGALLAVLVKFIFPFKNIRVIVRLGTVFKNLFYAPGGSRLKRIIWEYITISFTYRLVNKIVCSTRYMRHALISQSSNLKPKIVVIRNYVDKEKVEELAEEPIEIQYKYFISVGRLEREKNYQGIIEAFNSIKDQTELHLIILGDGSLRAEILQTISSYGLQKRVKLLRFVENPYKYIAKAEGLLLFSDFEGMPNVVIESLICKTPVIVSDYPGVDDIITHDENGLIVRRGDTSELASSLERLSADNSLCRKLAENGYKTALKFTTSISKFEHLINELLQKIEPKSLDSKNRLD
jgi:N-acetylgalactosamine-N,N'-diacetylbacillosaminyl-diphospho-undecaprenol 4-alpha-N-acetylgalactosaminyltransferase